jgi:hypothetical protein
MLFVPCHGGISHNEAESITPAWAEAGLLVLADAVIAAAGDREELGMRIAIGGFLHESHSFAPLPTGWRDFLEPAAGPPCSARDAGEGLRGTAAPHRRRDRGAGGRGRRSPRSPGASPTPPARSRPKPSNAWPR